MTSSDIVAVLFSNVFIAVGLFMSIGSLRLKDNFDRCMCLLLGTASYVVAIIFIVYVYPIAQKVIVYTTYP